MRKLIEVEEAKVLMTEAIEWSVMKWLREKKRVRKTADRANDALDHWLNQTRLRWPEDLRNAYAELTRMDGPPKRGSALGPLAEAKQTADEASHARMDAEKTFDEAERQLSTSMARDGCRKAIHSWELHEKAIRVAERLVPPAQR